MNREQFYNLTGEYPEDVFGADWEESVEEFESECIDNDLVG